MKFWDEIAAESETKAKVVKILKQYNADMVKTGRLYRYGNAIGFVKVVYLRCLSGLL